MTYDGNLLYRNYNELKESKRLHIVDFNCYCYGDKVHPSEISSQINILCFKAKMKHPELNFFPQFFKDGYEKVDKALDTELRELGMADENGDYVECPRNSWEDDIELPCSFDKVCRNLIPR